MVEIAGLIKHPELMDRDTLYELRSLLALHPYYQTARLLMLQNLYLLHDPAFDEELRRAAIYITDRRVIFQMIEAAHYQIVQAATNQESTKHKAQSSESRTVTLIDSFLDAMPDTDEQSPAKRKPTPADAAVDYVAYLLETEAGNTDNDTPQLKGQDHTAERKQRRGIQRRGIFHRNPCPHLHQAGPIPESPGHHRTPQRAVPSQERLLHRPDTFPGEINNKQQ